MTEITHMTDTASPAGWVLYDGDCRMCRRGVRQLGPVLRRRGFTFEPLQTPWVKERLGLRDDQLLTEMRVLTGGGQVHGGADAVVFLARHLWWAFPIALLARIPLAMRMMHPAYRWVARHRGRVSEMKRDESSFVNGTREQGSKASNEGD